EQIESVIGRVDRSGRCNPTQPLASPGLLDRHYAPHALLELAVDDGRARVAELVRTDQSVGWLTWPEVEPVSNVVRLELPRDSVAYAAGFYVALHNLDAAEVQRIIVAQPPDGDEWL